MDIILRDMKREDWEAVASIYQEGMDTKRATFQTKAPSYEEWDRAHLSYCRFVAEFEGEVVGWTGISPYSSRPVYSGVAEESIYIKTGYRGKHIGEKLLSKLIEESEKQGIWTLQAGIMEINEASIALHKKMGFRIVGHRERIGKDSNGVWQNTVLMERRSKTVGII
ncbi:N-acetyltransferase [Mobilitalea sibirica]|uniref:N-acetyltransferase n=1 Tax=Mobilitalea sibirica TaxID=1462919 RepID=A0A8J7GXS4_9FIRM|nr:GNAT family N-acetyltransferase [Mobilitalea sibirica]MBH1940089.1 N-acetyltransferase [Mobilitalea sibirica]